MAFSAQHIRDARNHLRKQDPVMKKMIQSVGPFTVKVQRDRFKTLARSMVSQQISGKAADSIWKRLESLVAETGITAEAIAKLSIDELRTAGVSNQKATYLLDLSQHVLNGNVQLNTLGRKTDEAIIEELTIVKGIGVWTAQMFLIFGLGRLDVLPTDDLGIKNSIQKYYELKQLPTKTQIETLAQPWRPYASVASWYLWNAIDQDV